MCTLSPFFEEIICKRFVQTCPHCCQTDSQYDRILGGFNIYMFVVDILTSISSGNDIKNALKSLPIFHSHESVNIMNKTLSSGCLTIFIQFISNRGKKCEIRKYYSQLFLFSRCLLFNVSWIELSSQSQSDTYTFVFQETLRI